MATIYSGRALLLLSHNKAGHSGGRPVSQIVDELSLKLSFLAWQLGMK